MTTTHNSPSRDLTSLGVNDALRLCEQTTDIDTILALTHHPAPSVRKRALVEMCPCRVQEDLSEFWERVFEMISDEDANVRTAASSINIKQKERSGPNRCLQMPATVGEQQSKAEVGVRGDNAARSGADDREGHAPVVVEGGVGSRPSFTTGQQWDFQLVLIYNPPRQQTSNKLEFSSTRCCGRNISSQAITELQRLCLKPPPNCSKNCVLHHGCQFHDLVFIKLRRAQSLPNPLYPEYTLLPWMQRPLLLLSQSK
ncbi:hypothetical protein C0Q70_19835 [Pomacea canaliculata]|uniref:Uncharacterized protein n=1 Tax=Pomacea canaliculata TaxID=400727 RepID=A0A2T7NDU8_POMCA|nr:hypothetical protein C0Q70_19835 [Pomacea canaliculata]